MVTPETDSPRALRGMQISLLERDEGKSIAIPLTRGKFALIDRADLQEAGSFLWHYRPESKGYGGYAYTQVKGFGPGEQIGIPMHHKILGLPGSIQIDHKNGNGLDNRRENLRECTHQQNQANSKFSRKNKSGFRGVTWHKVTRKWAATIAGDNGRRHLGCFDTIEEAAQAFDREALARYGEFARLNFPISLNHDDPRKFKCHYCSCGFLTLVGLGIHMNWKHPAYRKPGNRIRKAGFSQWMEPAALPAGALPRCSGRR